MRYYIERYYPLVLSIIVSGLFYTYHSKIDNLEETVKKLLDAALAICGALLGFLLTILTIINTIDTRRMRFVKESGAIRLLNRYLKVALYSNIVSISVYFLTPILFSSCESSDTRVIIYTCVVLIVSFTWIANIRFSRLFIKLLSDPKEDR